ncbi:LOW QUALITY PROTEIN: hypothetical protein PHMEG_00033269 [Phytophthora megakarya]|uniref:Uncharacterized protein n=1 Tax=Phytophthora megakarya TaxID=4795 RepID=A0A225UUK8_9STRA|nr:LOW QUALITY PROTEIN: hypothetical protein PHMEG_00033269 [Phytophthora megakarya]
MFGLKDVVTSSYAFAARRSVFAIDAWTEDGTHFVEVIAFTETETFLLCLSVLSDEPDMSSDAIIELLDVVLDTYEIDITQLCFFVCDHASVKKAKVSMIGCASHRFFFNLAVQEVMQGAPINGKLNTTKNRHHLREVDVLMPVERDKVEQYLAMINRYFRIYHKFDQVDDRLVDFIPRSRENVRVEALHDDLRNVESVNKKIQSMTTTLLDARVLFDHVIQHYSSTAEKQSPMASLVKLTDFENGVIKLRVGKAANLSRQKRTAVGQHYGETPPNTPHGLHWSPPTFNDVQRLFSRAGIVFSLLRRSLNPTTLEMVLFLHYNRSLWEASAVGRPLKTPGRNSALFR